MAISMLKIRRPLGRLIFNMGIAIPGKTVFLIETAPSYIIAILISNYTHFRRRSQNDVIPRIMDDVKYMVLFARILRKCLLANLKVPQR